MRGTHFLNNTGAGTSQDCERKRESTGKKGLRTGGTHKLEGAEEQVRTRKESERAKATHFLASAERWTSQDMGQSERSEGHSLSIEGRGRDKSGYGKNASE